MKTSELTGAALDWAVARCEGINYEVVDGGLDCDCPDYSTYWSQGGPIIEREKIELKYLGFDNPPYWGALKFSPGKYERTASIGPTPLIAAMRCYCASRLGVDIEIPEELK